MSSEEFYLRIFILDEKLKQIFKLRPLQTECMEYRNFISEYKTMIKRTCESELKNLMTVEMKIDQINLKMPDEKLIPTFSGEIEGSKVY